MLNNKNILVTGGTGSFGQKFTEIVFQRYTPKKLIVYSRDEFKQFEMAKKFPADRYPIRYFLGDVRDMNRLSMALKGVDYVIHSAALKQVPAAEYNPFEAVKTNVLGIQNIVEASLERGVKKVIALSTDKAVSPINLYGATKLVMEKILVAANSYAGASDIVFSAVRYGNVVGSRGSVIPFFLQLVRQGKETLPITDEKMTRFWITLEQGVELVLTAIHEARGGEIFVPKIPSMKVVDLAKVIKPDCKLEIIGIRPGEKVHESLISEEEGKNTVSMNVDGRKIYVILPQFYFKEGVLDKYKRMEKVPDGFCYQSDQNDWWLTEDDLRKTIGWVQEE